MARNYRYVVDHGDIYRMTVTRYRRYLLACSDGIKDAGKFGTCIGSALTVNKLTPAEFRELFNAEHREAVEARMRRDLSVRCPTCDALPGDQCVRLGQRYERVYYRGTGASTRDFQRKVPHDARSRAAELANAGAA